MSNGTFAKLKLKENLFLVKKLGFENVEFNLKSVQRENDTSVYEAVKLIANYGLLCLTLHSATLPVKDEVEIHRAVYYGKISVDFASKLGSPIMVIHSNVSRQVSLENRRKFLHLIFEELKPYAHSHGLKLSLENLSYASHGYGKNVAEIEEILDAVGDDEIGLTLDFCHSTASGTTQSLLEKYYKRLCNVHLSNRGHKPFAEKTPELVAFLKNLKKYDYRGPVTLELNRKCTMQEIAQTKAIVECVMRECETEK